jgi:hypothetical protein
MRRNVLVLLAVVALLAVTVIPAFAITDGELDGEGHPYVGLMVAQDADGNPLWRCSGTLLSSKLFLTAGHCTESPRMATHTTVRLAGSLTRILNMTRTPSSCMTWVWLCSTGR